MTHALTLCDTAIALALLHVLDFMHCFRIHFILLRTILIRQMIDDVS